MSRSFTLPAAVVEDVHRIQGLLQLGMFELRALMQNIQSTALEPRDLAQSVDEIISRFRQHSQVDVRAVCDLRENGMRSSTCREVLRIVQEGLVNVQKHSGAKHVRVELKDGPSHLQLTIEDDGKGFDVVGRLTLADLDKLHKGPVVLKRRVQGLGGSLVLESYADSGSRLLITIPHAAHYTAA